jgi:cutinase
MVGHFEDANTKCPEAVIVAGGYSQGAALAAAATTDVNDAVREKIAGVVLFGYTKNLREYSPPLLGSPTKHSILYKPVR